MVTARCTGITGVLLLAILCFPVPAESTAAPFGDRSDGSGYYADAEVVSVSPRYGWHEVVEPVRECIETAPRYMADDRRSGRHRNLHHYQYRDEPSHGRGETAAGLVGGLIGGLIGHQFGGGDGKKALTVAGALLGASVARDRVRRQSEYTRYHDHDGSYATTRHCTRTERARRVRGVQGYDVTYRYQGATFHKWVNEYPGDTIRVYVAVEPLD